MVKVIPVLRRGHLAFVLVAVLVGGLLSSCAAPEPFVPQVMPSEFDQDITTLLPIGPHKITLEDKFGSLTVQAQGYIDLPASHDLRGSCAYDIRVDTLNPGHTTVYEMRKAKNELSWRRVVSTTDPKHEARWPNSIGVWFAGDDPVAPAPLIMLPILWLEEPYGGDYWCNLRRLDQVSVIANPATGELSYRIDALNSVKAANLDAWLFEMLPAAGYKGRAYHRAAADLREALAASYMKSLYEARPMRIIRSNGSTALTAASEDRVLTATFESTATRSVELVEGFRAYIEKLGDPDVRAEWDSAIQNYRSYREEFGDTE